MRQIDGQRMVFEKPTEVVEGQRDGLDEVVLALEKAAVAIGTEGLKDTHEDIAPEVAKPTRPFFSL